MSRLLYIKGSPMGEMSNSVAVADAFVEAYRESHPGDEVDVLDLFKEDLPEFDRAAAGGKYAIMHGGKPAPAEKKAWRAVEKLIERFKGADKYVFAVPMWNFGIPYRLKQLIDVIVQPGYTFSFDPETGYSGLVAGKPALAVYARGGVYSEEAGTAGMDMQKPYLELILGFMGFEDVRSIVVQPTLMAGPEKAAEQREAAAEQARRLAAGF